MEHSFRKGDWVAIRQQDKDRLLGEILEIGWRSTRIRTPGHNLAVIPNSQFTTFELINYTQGRKHQLVQLEVSVKPKAQAEAVRKALVESASEAKHVLKEPLPTARPLEIAHGHVKWRLDYAISSFDQADKVAGEVMENAWQKLDQIDALI
jgi:small-conductance mechanosensitive channel